MKRTRKHAKSLTIALVLSFGFSVILAGCGKGKATDQPTPTPNGLPPATISYAFVGGYPMQGQEDVYAKINQMVKAKINATINFMPMSYNDFSQKMSIIHAANDESDLEFSSNWGQNDFLTGVAKGYFMPLDDLLKKYAPQTYKTPPEQLWAAAKVNGKIYGIINYQMVAQNTCLMVNKELADKFKFDIKNVKKLEDLEPYLENVKSLKDNYTVPATVWGDLAKYYGMEYVISGKTVGAVKLGDTSTKVFNQYKSDEFKAWINLMYSWNQKGYIQTKVGGTTDFFKKYSSIYIGGTCTPTTEADESKKKFPLYAKQISPDNWISTGSVDASLTTISSTSKNPERAMMFIELLNTDKDIYNTLSYGLEGVDYKKVNETTIDLIPGSKYKPFSNWMFGNAFNAYLTADQNPTVNQKLLEMNNTAKISPLMGFTFDTTNVKAEVANVNAVTDEFLDSFSKGIIDPATAYPKFIDKLDKAGADKVMVELQKQIDAWKATLK